MSPKLTDYEKIAYITHLLAPNAVFVERTIQIGDRTLHFDNLDEVYKITYNAPDGSIIGTVYP